MTISLGTGLKMINEGRLSISAVGNGGGTSTNTTANSTTTAFRRRSSGRRATTRRQDLAFHGSVNRGIKNREQSMGGGIITILGTPTTTTERTNIVAKTTKTGQVAVGLH